jgi:hypothetical protein
MHPPGTPQIFTILGGLIGLEFFRRNSYSEWVVCRLRSCCLLLRAVYHNIPAGVLIAAAVVMTRRRHVNSCFL